MGEEIVLRQRPGGVLKSVADEVGSGDPLVRLPSQLSRPPQSPPPPPPPPPRFDDRHPRPPDFDAAATAAAASTMPKTKTRRSRRRRRPSPPPAISTLVRVLAAGGGGRRRGTAPAAAFASDGRRRRRRRRHRPIPFRSGVVHGLAAHETIACVEIPRECAPSRPPSALMPRQSRPPLSKYDAYASLS